jgi:(R,R)-butanediol dehydrogenase/meso-butanediol dehydrogenase/diacetyl reductase
MSTHAHPHPTSGEKTPIVWGHEFSAVVTEVHPSVTNLRPGSRVAIEPIGNDGTCPSCLAGVPNLCDNMYLHGLHASGGMAESIIIAAKCCYELPANVSLEFGALVEPLAVAWQGVVVSGIQKGQTALVVGTGSIGLATILCLRAMGVKRVAASGRNRARNEILNGWALEAVIDAGNEDLVKRTKEVFDGSVLFFESHVYLEIADFIVMGHMSFSIRHVLNYPSTQAYLLSGKVASSIHLVSTRRR